VFDNFRRRHFFIFLFISPTADDRGRHWLLPHQTWVTASPWLSIRPS
jgi:hypothetical protein